jgi:hypothetical protein
MKIMRYTGNENYEVYWQDYEVYWQDYEVYWQWNLWGILAMKIRRYTDNEN